MTEAAETILHGGVCRVPVSGTVARDIQTWLTAGLRTTEARYRVHVVTGQRNVSAARDILDATLEKDPAVYSATWSLSTTP